jgi:hypothetical protein
MSLSTGHRGTAVALAGALLLGGLCLVGCTGVTTAKKPAHRVTGAPAADIVVARGTAPRGTAPAVWMAADTAAGKTAIGSFIAKLQAHAATPFEVKYPFGAGKVPAVIVYAVRPPDGLLFSESPMSGKNRTRIVVNGSGEYRCVQRTGQARWACQQLTEAGAAAQNKNFGIYTAAYWAMYLKNVVRAAGAKVTTSTMRPDAPPTIGKDARAGAMDCIGFRTAGFGVSTICAAAPGILGSVFLCQGSITIPMEWYITSPPASLFQLPPGATVTRLKPGQQ